MKLKMAVFNFSAVLIFVAVTVQSFTINTQVDQTLRTHYNVSLTNSHPIMKCTSQEIKEVGERIIDGSSSEFDEFGFGYTKMQYPISSFKAHLIDIGSNITNMHLFKSNEESNYFLGFGRLIGNLPDHYEYELMVKFNKRNSKQIGITMVRYEISTESYPVYFCNKYNFVSTTADSNINSFSLLIK